MLHAMNHKLASIRKGTRCIVISVVAISCPASNAFGQGTSSSSQPTPATPAKLGPGANSQARTTIKKPSAAAPVPCPASASAPVPTASSGSAPPSTATQTSGKPPIFSALADKDLAKAAAILKSDPSQANARYYDGGYTPLAEIANEPESVSITASVAGSRYGTANADVTSAPGENTVPLVAKLLIAKGADINSGLASRGSGWEREQCGWRYAAHYRSYRRQACPCKVSYFKVREREHCR